MQSNERFMIQRKRAEKAEARVAVLEAALREIDTNATLPKLYDVAEWWKHLASKRREIAQAALRA